MKFIHCKNCNEEVEFAKVSGEWFHSATYNTQCHPFGAHTEPTYAEPGFEVETDQGPIFGSCKNCGRTIQQGAFNNWYHVDTYTAHCVEEGYDTPIAEPAESETENPVETEVCKNCKSTIVPDPHGQYKWIHDDGYYFCYPGRKGGAVPESEFKPQSESEFGSDSNSGSDFGSLRNPGPEIESPSDTLAKPTAEGRGPEINFLLTTLFSLITEHPHMHMADKLRAVDAVATIAKMNIRSMRTEGTPQDDVDDHDSWGL